METTICLMTRALPPDLSTLGGRLKWARENSADAPSSTKQAGDLFGIPEPTYNAHERAGRGGRGFDFETARRYARRYNVSLLWLISGEGEPKPGAGLTSSLAQAINRLYDLDPEIQNTGASVLTAFIDSINAIETKTTSLDNRGNRHMPPPGQAKNTLDHARTRGARALRERQNRDASKPEARGAGKSDPSDK